MLQPGSQPASISGPSPAASWLAHVRWPAPREEQCSNSVTQPAVQLWCSLAKTLPLRHGAPSLCLCAMLNSQAAHLHQCACSGFMPRYEQNLAQLAVGWCGGRGGGGGRGGSGGGRGGMGGSGGGMGGKGIAGGHELLSAKAWSFTA